MEMNDKEEPKYRDFAEEARVCEAEERGLAEVIAPGHVFSLSGSALGIVNMEQAIANVGELTTRAERAFQAGFYVETMSLRLQHTELWLRLYFIAKNGNGRLFAAVDRRTFGQIIADCEREGFDTELVRLMRAFNLHRTRAIHQFILGATDYEHLRVICTRYTALPARVGAFTRTALGFR